MSDDDFIGVDIATDIAKTYLLLSHIEDGAPKAIMRALNRTIDGVKTDVVNQVKDTYDIKPGKVRKVLKAIHSGSSNLEARIEAKGNRIPLIQFHVTPNSPGKQPAGSVLRASVKKSGGKPIPGAFIASASGGVGVFKRVGKSSLPIEELTGPAIPQMLNEPTIQKYVMDGAEKRLSVRIDHEIDYILGGGKGKSD